MITQSLNQQVFVEGLFCVGDCTRPLNLGEQVGKQEEAYNKEEWARAPGFEWKRQTHQQIITR